MMKIKFEEIPEFNKDLKRLLKKFRSLNDDLQVLKQILQVFPDERPPFSFRIENLGIATCVIKVKKIACKSIKGRGVQSGPRLVYAYFEDFSRIVFIELYYKGEKALESRERITENFM